MTSSPLFNEAQAANHLGIARKTLGGWRCTGKGPAYLKLESAVRYSVADLDAFSASGRIAR